LKIISFLEDPELIFLALDVTHTFTDKIRADSISKDFFKKLEEKLLPFTKGFWGEAINDIVEAIHKNLEDRVKKEEKTSNGFENTLQ
jgi:hypothetical protein